MRPRRIECALNRAERGSWHARCGKRVEDGIIGGMVSRPIDAWYQYPGARSWHCPGPGREMMEFHAAWPGYAPTPLTEAPGLAEEWQVARVFVKDESWRLGMPAFKVLGASWAVFSVLSERVGGNRPETFEELARTLNPLSPFGFVTATDGNHGRALAHVARRLGLTCRVFVPEFVDRATVDAIEGEGAVVTLVAGPYDEAVRRAADVAQRAGSDAILMQDTAWHGYQEVPGWIVDGYSTMFWEIDDQIGKTGLELVVVPIGVGSLAQAAVAHYRSDSASRRPALLGVEPDTAACVLASLQSGELRTVRTGESVMTGLNCGTPSSLAWRYLRSGLDASGAVSDEAALVAVADLAAIGISTGPSGAAALAGARAALTGPGSEDRRLALTVDNTSTVVLLCTEGTID